MQFKPILLLLICGVLAANISAQQLNPADFENLNFRFIGPDGNRAIACVGVPGDPMINYIGAASGGLWKTDDGGVSWNPIFDDQNVSSIGSVALAPQDPDQVWVGTGETFVIRPAHAMGDGIYKSSDAGKTWKNMGLEKTGRIGRVIVHPRDTNTIYAAALGHTYGPQQDRGVYRTKDGGKTWKRILFVDEGTGAADIAMNPNNPDILYAGMWSVHINTWGLNSGGPGGGIYRSLDGGETWESMTKNGLPGGEKRNVGKTAVAISQSNPDVVYALFEIESPALYRSADNGKTWKLMTRNHTINERAPYYTRIAIAPDNEDEVYFINVRFSKSIDGGKTLVEDPPRGGGDNHDMWIDPTNPSRMIVAHDGCVSMSLNRGKTFQRIVLPIAQMYHVSVDNQIPYNVYGNRQDGYSYRGPSNSLQGSIPMGLWQAVGGCESGFAKPDPFDNNIIFSGCYDGGLERFDLRTGYAQEVRVWPEAGYGWAPKDMTYRWHWNFPMSFSPHVPHRIYAGSQYIHMSDDGGNSWEIISPDLTLNRKDHQESSGGVAVDNLMTFDGATLFAIEESPLEAGLIWVGTNDGQVQLSRNYGKDWVNLTKNIPNLPPWGTIACITPSKHSASTAYIAVDLHQMGDFDPYVFKTSDYGQSWTLISGSVPKSVHSFAHVIKEDPKMPGILYLGVDNGVYISVDDGKNWMRLRSGLPPAPVYWLEIQEQFEDLVVATYGRGFYILDDISVIREYAKELQGKSEDLFPLRAAYRFNEREGVRADAMSFVTGRSPQYGANIDYFLRDSSQQNVMIEVLDSDGKVIRTMKGKPDAGINRVYWNLSHDGPQTPKLRTRPPNRDWVEFNEEGWRTLRSWDLDLVAGQRGPRVSPGWYTIRMKIGDRTYTETLEVRKDPHSEGNLGDIKRQEAFALALRAALDQTVNMINQTEIYRKNIDALMPSFKKSAQQTEAEALAKKAFDIASRLYDVNLTGAREDAFRSPIQLYGRLSALGSDINGSGIDFAPTDQQQDVHKLLQSRLDAVQADFDQLMQQTAAFNKKYKTNISASLAKP